MCCLRCCCKAAAPGPLKAFVDCYTESKVEAFVVGEVVRGRWCGRRPLGALRRQQSCGTRGDHNVTERRVFCGRCPVPAQLSGLSFTLLKCWAYAIGDLQV